MNHLPIVGSAVQAKKAYEQGDSEIACLYGMLAAVELIPIKRAVQGVNAWRNISKQGGVVVQQPSKSLTITGSGEWKSTTWNLGEAAVNKKHHNWHKIFGDKKPTLKEIDPYVKEALMKGQWKKIDTIINKGKIIGDKIELIQEVNGHKIWLGGMQKSTGEVIINNAAVQ